MGKASAKKLDKSASRAGVAVVGSLNMDLVVKTEMMPQPGQTVLGQDLQEIPGGKGANQAAAVGRLAAKIPRAAPSCRLVGRIGDDIFGQRLLDTLATAHVDVSYVLKTKGVPSGAALILVDRHGENAIVVAGGANQRLTSTDLLAQRKAIEASAVVAMQLEIPYDTVACAIALAKRVGALTLLDPSPAPPDGIPESLYHVDILTPNQGEAQILSGLPVRSLDDARRAAERIVARGTRTVIVKMGPAGALLVVQDPANPARTTAQHVPGFRVPVVDTTAAGDAFNGALAVALSEGKSLPEAVCFANAAGALACTKLGAQNAIPTRMEVESLLAK